MAEASRGRIALYSAVFVTVAVGSILAVLADNPPLGALGGVTSGVIVAAMLWPRRSK